MMGRVGVLRKIKRLCKAGDRQPPRIARRNDTHSRKQRGGTTHVRHRHDVEARDQGQGQGRKPRARASPSQVKPKARTKTKAERAEINRQNSRRSTGPRSAQGKSHSSQNAVTHGLTARSGLLIGEDPDEFEALKQMMIGRFKPYNDAELTVVERIAGDIWLSDRAAQAAGKRLAERLRHGPLEQAKKEKDEAIELGDRLFWQPAFPLPFTRRSHVGELTEPPCSENAIHPHHPARLCLRLEQTVAGCDWLIERWDAIEAAA